MKTLIAIGAYGRKATKADWLAGKDFQIFDGPYFSQRDTNYLKQDGYVSIRFCDLRTGEILFIVELN